MDLASLIKKHGDKMDAEPSIFVDFTTNWKNEMRGRPVTMFWLNSWLAAFGFLMVYLETGHVLLLSLVPSENPNIWVWINTYRYHF